MDMRRDPAYAPATMLWEQEREVERLKQDYVDGACGVDTFEQRLELTLTRAPTTQPRRRRRGRTRGYALLDAMVGDRPLLVGRSSSCELVLDNDTVSRRHALLARQAGRIVVTDLGSTNGTLLNGRRVAQAEVRPGDDLRLGEIVLPL